MTTLVAVSGAASARATASKPTRTAPGGTIDPFSFMQPDGSIATVTAPPKRIVVVDNPTFEADELLALGFQPTGGEIYAENASPQFTHELTKDIQLTSYANLGNPSGPDLEAMAAAHPDPIVGAGGSGTVDVPQLEAIAPLVDIPTTYSHVNDPSVQLAPGTTLYGI